MRLQHVSPLGDEGNSLGPIVASTYIFTFSNDSSAVSRSFIARTFGADYGALLKPSHHPFHLLSERLVSPAYYCQVLGIEMVVLQIAQILTVD